MKSSLLYDLCWANTPTTFPSSSVKKLSATPYGNGSVEVVTKGCEWDKFDVIKGQEVINFITNHHHLRELLQNFRNLVHFFNSENLACWVLSIV